MTRVFVFGRVGVPLADADPSRCAHAEREYAPRCGKQVDYHVLTEDGQQYGYGIVSMHCCGDHLLFAITAGTLISAHLAGPQCFDPERTLLSSAQVGCVPPHVFDQTSTRILNPKDHDHD